MDLNKTIICPKCSSKNIYIDKKGFSTGKAIAGGLLTGNIFVAAAAGGIGANKIVLTCLDCGHKFNIGEGGHDINKSYPTQAEIKEFERHVIPKEEMPELIYYKCECGKWFSGEKGAYCPACGRKMSERNIPTADEIKQNGKSGCLGIILVPLIIVLTSLIISCKNISSSDSSQSTTSIDSTSVTDSKNATSNWELYNFEDEFGDKTSKKYLGITGKGTVSANANKNFDMTAYLFIRNEEIYFKFHLEDLEYVCPDNLPITMKIKDSDGEVYSFDFICKQNGEIGLRTESENKQPYYQFISILEKGGVISGSTEIYHSPYKFKIDVSGYQDALKRL